MPVKVAYELQTPWPTDVKNPEGFEAVDWTQDGEIPFLPVIGMYIDCGDGDLRMVKEVYWHAEEPNSVGVYFEDDGPRARQYWQRGGWQTKDLPRCPTASTAKKAAK